MCEQPIGFDEDPPDKEDELELQDEADDIDMYEREPEGHFDKEDQE